MFNYILAYVFWEWNMDFFLARNLIWNKTLLKQEFNEYAKQGTCKYKVFIDVRRK